MCGLYAFRKGAEEVASLFRLSATPVLAPRDHVAPGGPIAVLRPGKSGLEMTHMRWGLVPAWAKEVKPGKPLINARAETVLEKASFRNAIRRRRCLIPADGFYEWHGEPGRKQQYLFRRPDSSAFAFAGLWESWMGADGSELESACIITTTPNAVMAPIHDRMPVVIAPEDQPRWLDCATFGAETVTDLLKPAPDNFFVADKITISKPPKPPSNQLDLF